MKQSIAGRIGVGRLGQGIDPPARALFVPMLFGAMVCCVGTERVNAQTSHGVGGISREYAIKAAYLYQFARYVEWPPQAFTDEISPLIVGVLGRDPFGNILDEIAQTRRVEGRPITVRRFQTLQTYSPCHILFVSSSVPPEELRLAIERMYKAPVLLVGEAPGFAAEGGTINFVLDANRIRFEINIGIAKQNELRISSKLLSLATIVGNP